MEFVVVQCSDGADLAVLVDEVESGRTGQTLQVQRGTHTFALSEASGYRPDSQTIQVKDTVAIEPLEVSFERT